MVEGTLAHLQDVPKYPLIQVMQTFPPHIISAHQMEICGDMPLGKLHDQGSKHIADLEHQNFTTLRSLDFLKEEIYIDPSVSFLSCTQLLGLEYRFLEDGMSIVLNHAMQNYVFIIEYDLEIENAPSQRSAALSFNNSDELGAQPLLEHSNDLSTCIEEDR